MSQSGLGQWYQRLSASVGDFKVEVIMIVSCPYSSFCGSLTKTKQEVLVGVGEGESNHNGDGWLMLLAGFVGCLVVVAVVGSLRESIPRLLNEGSTAMTACCAPACSQALPVKPQGVWARGIDAWARSRDRHKWSCGGGGLRGPPA